MSICAVAGVADPGEPRPNEPQQLPATKPNLCFVGGVSNPANPTPHARKTNHRHTNNSQPPRANTRFLPHHARALPCRGGPRPHTKTTGFCFCENQGPCHGFTSKPGYMLLPCSEACLRCRPVVEPDASAQMGKTEGAKSRGKQQR